MAHGHNSKEKIVYVGDSRIRKDPPKMPQEDYTVNPGKTEVFIPNFLLKEWMVGVVVLTGILALVLSEPAPLGYPADPTNTSFIPMPDWYFLFLYQLLKYPYTSDQFVLLGTLVLPGIAFGALIVTPFLDTSKERRFYKRPVASSLMILSLICISYLTLVSWHHYENELAASGIVPEHIQREQEIQAGKVTPGVSAGETTAKLPALVAADDPGAKVYETATCIMCHAAGLKGTAAAPALLGVGDTFNKDQILGIMHDGMATGSKVMPPGQYEASIAKGLTDDDMNKLAEWLAKQKSQ